MPPETQSNFNLVKITTSNEETEVKDKYRQTNHVCKTTGSSCTQWISLGVEKKYLFIKKTHAKQTAATCTVADKSFCVICAKGETEMQFILVLTGRNSLYPVSGVINSSNNNNNHLTFSSILACNKAAKVKCLCTSYTLVQLHLSRREIQRRAAEIWWTVKS